MTDFTEKNNNPHLNMASQFGISSNYVSDIIDEIALEGLDGITLDALWKRLTVRPNFCLKIDEHSKKFIWNLVRRLKDVEFYKLPQQRPLLEHYDFQLESDHQEAISELDALYPHCPTNEPGIFGSCKDFSTRTNVTKRVTKLSLEEIDSTLGLKMVIVASQELRNLALMGNQTNPNIDFSNLRMQYVVLERIGRSRYLGMSTFGKGSLLSVVDDSKSIFHYLKFLLHHKLIKKQSLLGSLQANTNCSKVHLVRFYEECLNECQVILQTAIEELKTKPNHLLLCEDFYRLFDPEKRKRIHKYTRSNMFKKYVTLTKAEPYRVYFPDAKPAEWERKSRNAERVVRCFQLRDANTEVADIFYKDFEVDEEEATGFLANGVFYKDMPMLSQAYKHIKDSGSRGMTSIELEEKMGINKSFARCLIKRLIQGKHCTNFIEVDGRKRSNRYLVGQNKKCMEAASEIAKILNESPEAIKQEPDETVDGNNVVAEEAGEKLNISHLEENVSYRKLRRIAMIIKTIKTHRYRLFHQVSNYLAEEEAKEGLTARIDRNTVARLLDQLEKDQLIKKIVLTSNDSSTDQSVKLYADPAFAIDDKFAETILHTHNSIHSIEMMNKVTKEVVDDLENDFSDIILENLMLMKKMLKNIKYSSDKGDSKDCGDIEATYCPKFVRLNMIHDLLFYLVYGYTGITERTQEELIEELSKTCAIDEEVKKELPPLYGTQLSHYLFIPPLKTSMGHKERRMGWFVLSDLLLRMPLSLIIKILRIGDTPPELLAYLHHPIRKHYLVKDLPLPLRQMLFVRQQQLTPFYNDIKRLCFTGLLRLGTKCGKEYYQTLAFLNRRATLLNTTTSPEEYYQIPEDMEFEVKSYEFKTKEDVKTYWMDMFNICLATNLGVKTIMIGKEILSERELSKESLRKYLDPITPAQAVEQDVGNLPGDHRGAAGLDSVMFSFLKSNWIGPFSKTKEQVKKKKLLKKPLTPKIKKDHPKRRFLFLQRNRVRKVIKKTESEEKVITFPEASPHKPCLRRIKEREVRFKRDKKVAYDEIDMEALKLMSTLRVTWSTVEDNLLLICRVAMIYLCPNHRTFVRIPWVEVRRVLQENIPESRNKTQKAIARRIIYMLKNPTTVRSVSLCLEELKQIPEVAQRFECSELLNSIKPSAPNLGELQAQLYERFHELVIFMKDRFMHGTNFSVQKSKSNCIPDNLSEFIEKYELPSVTKESIGIKAIREDVIRAILMSSLSCRADKTSCVVQLFEIYRQYEEDELQNAVRKLHVDKVITINKRPSNPIFKNGRYLPLTYSPYQLSHAFQHMLNMKYAHKIYNESFNQVNNLFLLTDNENSFEVDLNECNIALFLLACKNVLTFNCTVPEQIILLDSRDRSDLNYSKILDRYCELLKFSNINSKFVCTSGKIISRIKESKDSQDGEGIKETETETEPEPGATLEPAPEPEHERERERKREPDEPVCKKMKLDDSCAQVVKTAAEENTEANSCDDVEEGNMTIVPQYNESNEANEEGDQLNVDKVKHRSSRIVLYMMREEATKEITNDSSKLAQEFFVVNASKVQGIIKTENCQLYKQKMEPKFITKITKNIISRLLVPLTLVDLDEVTEQFFQGGHTEDEVNILKNTLNFIENQKELGVTKEDLRNNCNSPVLPKILRHLLANKIIIKSGISETRYVGQKYCTPWLLNSFRMTRLEREKIKPSELNAVELKHTETTSEEDSSSSKRRKKGIITINDLKSETHSAPPCSINDNYKVKMIIRPWVRIDGTLNRKVLDRFLGTVLGHIMANPGVSIESVTKKFAPSVTPVWTKDLIEILHEIGCVKFIAQNVKKISTIFEKSVVEISDECTGLEDDRNIAVEAEVDAITTLGLFIGNKSYSKDFLVD